MKVKWLEIFTTVFILILLATIMLSISVIIMLSISVIIFAHKEVSAGELEVMALSSTKQATRYDHGVGVNLIGKF